MYFCISVHACACVCVCVSASISMLHELALLLWNCRAPVIYFPFHEFFTKDTKDKWIQGLSQHARVNHSWMFIKHKHILCLPATLATLSASWLFAPFERLGLRCLPPPVAERMLRRCTSVALKKATMKGCLFWGPLRPTRPAVRGLILSPVGGDREDSATGVQTDQCANEKSWAPEFK